MPMSWTAGAVEIAKTEGLHLVKLTLNGKYAKRGTIEMSGPCGPETAKLVSDLMIRLADAKERMK